MAHIIDARGAGGAIVLLGEFLTLPPSTGNSTVAPMLGAMRRKPPSDDDPVPNRLQYYIGPGPDDWADIATFEQLAGLYLPVAGGRLTGPATFAADVLMEANLSVSGTVTAPFFDGVATSAQFAADIAERYHADEHYEPGTVLVIGGLNEVTACTGFMDLRVAGIVSTKPAYGMNLAAGPDETHPLIALKGRVPCKVFGSIRKGEFLVTSAIRGHAQAAHENLHPCAVIGRALADKWDVGSGMVEVMV